MTQTVEQVLREATLYSDDQEYRVIHLPSGAITAAAGVIAEIGEPFCALIVDKYEVSIVIPNEAWEDFSPRLRDYKVADKSYKLITFDTPLEMSLVGFMARVSRALADANISILPLAAYTRDHILVAADQFDIAMTALQKLKSGT